MLAMSNSSLMPCEERRRRRAFRGAWLLCFLATLAWPAAALLALGLLLGETKLRTVP
mgnify:CR=1 FL=1